MNDILNPEQRAAAEAGNGPIVIIAGPGTGKTKTLTARLRYLAGKHVPSDKVLALTFTNKAMKEMRERAGSDVAHIATFHGLCYDLIKQTTGEAPMFVSDADRMQILRDLDLPEELRDLSLADIGLRITRAKNAAVPSRDGTINIVLSAYNAALSLHNLFDFDDLLLRARDMLVRGQAKTDYQYILVDEFQDTNTVQYDILRLLDHSGNMLVIGDPRQAIYGFRGASATVFDRFMADYPQAKIVQLSENYRSGGAIVDLANAIFPQAHALTPHNDDRGRVRAIEVLDEHGEARFILDDIEHRMGGTTMLKSSDHHTTADGKSRFSDFAVLYRSRAVAATLQKHLEESGIPYQIAGEGSPYEQPFARAVIDAFRYFVGGPVPKLPKLSESQSKALLDSIQSDGATVSQLADTIVRKAALANDRNKLALRHFQNSLIPFDDLSVEHYLHYVDQISSQEFYDPNADAVTLLTIHAAKGLEFANVFLIGTEEGILPHKRSIDPESIEEERRLFYVAATRAKESLTIFHARTRSGAPVTLSRFIADLPANVLPAVIDPDLSAQAQRRVRWRHKNSQTSLF